MPGLARKVIICLVYSITLVTVWGLCFLSIDKANQFTAGLGLCFTFLSGYFFNEKIKKEDSNSLRYLVLFVTALYPMALYLQLFKSGFFERFADNFYELYFYVHFVNPLLVAFVTLVLVMFVWRDLYKPSSLFLFISITVFYSYFFFPDWRSFNLRSMTENFAGKESTEKVDNVELNTTGIDLANFSFIDHKRDTVTILPIQKDFLLIETWNETCVPCIKAMKELPPFYEAIHQKLEFYYVYESSSERARNSFEKIFDFKHINHRERILVDVNQNFYNAIGMKGFPYFLLFNNKGELLDFWRGYPGKEKLSTGIESYIH